MNRTKGFVCVIIAAFIFGYTPILGKLSYDGGSNSIMLVFLRNTMCLPIIYAMLKYKKVSIRVTKKEFGKLFILSVFSTILTALLLYSSYNYVSVGMATTVHYVYPIFVAIISTVIFKEKITKVKVAALVISFIGILMFFDGNGSGEVSFLGLFIALASGIAYGIALIYMDKSGLKDYYPLLVTFYTCVCSGVVMLVFALLTNKLTFNLTPEAWGYSFLVSILASVIAITFMQIGVKNVGPTTTAILCTFEPITSVVLGVLLLNEYCSAKVVFGCVLIFVAVGILSIFGREKKNKNTPT